MRESCGIPNATLTKYDIAPEQSAPYVRRAHRVGHRLLQAAGTTRADTAVFNPQRAQPSRRLQPDGGGTSTVPGDSGMKASPPVAGSAHCTSPRDPTARWISAVRGQLAVRVGRHRTPHVSR